MRASNIIKVKLRTDMKTNYKMSTIIPSGFANVAVKPGNGMDQDLN
jgi:hypothetical protein